jgi:hypothetical protein
MMIFNVIETLLELYTTQLLMLAPLKMKQLYMEALFFKRN